MRWPWRHPGPAPANPPPYPPDRSLIGHIEAGQAGPTKETPVMSDPTPTPDPNAASEAAAGPIPAPVIETLGSWFQDHKAMLEEHARAEAEHLAAGLEHWARLHIPAEVVDVAIAGLKQLAEAAGV